MPLHSGGIAPRPDPSPSSARSSPIDGLRALAALSVLCFHVWQLGPGVIPQPRTALFDKVLFEANLGLVCFFVLSGYLLYRSFARAALAGDERVDLKSYTLRRITRIVPAYYANIAGSLLLFWAVGYSTIAPSMSNLSLFAVFGQSYSRRTLTQVNPVTWTLCVEASFYVLLPLVGLIAYRLGPRRIPQQVAVVLGLVGVTIVWNAVVHAHGWKALASKTLLTYVAHFALGMLVATWVEHRRVAAGGRPRLGPRATASLVAAGLLLVAGNGYWHETSGSLNLAYALLANLPAALGFALVVAAAAQGTGPAIAWLRARTLVAVGLVSYGVYLWHVPLILAIRQLGMLPGAFVPRLGLVLLLALAAAALSWTLLERPLIRRAARARP